MSWDRIDRYTLRNPQNHMFNVVVGLHRVLHVHFKYLVNLRNPLKADDVSTCSSKENAVNESVAASQGVPF